MKNISLFFGLFILFLSSYANAQQFKVNQVKGNKAIIEMQNTETFTVGETYSATPGDSDLMSINNNSTKKGQRQHLIGLSFSATNSKTDLTNSVSQTGIDVSVKYGWNHIQYEFGPIGAFSYNESGNTKSTTLGAGAFGTYNFNENKPGQDLVFAAEGTLTYSIKKVTTSSLSYDDTYLAATVGPYAKWFLLSQDFNINAGLVYTYNSYKTGLQSGSSYNTTTFALVGGIATYF